MRRWTRKAMAWTTCGIALLLLGLWRLDYQVVALGLLMAGFMLVSYVRRTPQVVVRRRPSHLRVLEGDGHDMGFDVGSKEAWVDSVELHDSVPGYMRLEGGTNHMVLPLYKGEMRRTGYELDCPLRGAYRVGPVEMRTSDALGLFDQEDLVPGAHELDVVPLYVELRNLELQSRALKYNMGPVTINELGRSTDFYSIREYIKGDPYRKINWKASAKRRKLMINEDEKETLSDCTLFVDSRALAATGTPLHNFHETSLRTVLGLTRTLVSAKNRVMVVTYNESVNIVPPGLGMAHNRIVQAMLVETVARGSLTFDWAAGYARPFLKPRSDVVVFSPLVSDMTFFPAVLGLIRTGHRVVVVTAPMEAFEEEATGSQGSRAFLMGLQRSTNIAELEAAGVQVIDVEPDEPQLSVMVRVSAALGGEQLDIRALAGEEAEELPEFEEEPVPVSHMPVPRELQDEVLGIRLDLTRVAALQAGAVVALLGTCVLSWYLAADLWDTINTGGWGTMMDTPTYMMLVFTGLLLGWALSMLLGFLRYWRQRQPTSNLPYLAYAAVVLLVLWHLGSMLFNLNRGLGPIQLVWDMVVVPPMLGAIGVFRRLLPMAAVSVLFLVLFGLVQPNPVEEAWTSLLFAVCAVAFVELVWAAERFSYLHSLGGVPMARSRRGLDLFDRTVTRYMLVFGMVMGFAVLMTMVLTHLPSWYAPDPGSGLPVPVEAEGVFSPVYLLFWTVVLALVGRWAVLHFMDTPVGQRTVDSLRRRLLLPRGADDEGLGDGPTEEGPWEQEAPSPDVPVPQT